MEEPPLPTAAVSAGAGFWIRAGARLIDVVYGIGLGFVAGVLTGITLIILERTGLVAPGWQGRLKGVNIPGFGLSLLGGVLYHSLTEGMYGASLGKLICQLRVVTEDARPITMKQAFLRSLAYFVDALFFGLIAYSAMRKSDLNQRYGDRWARTVVVRSRDLPNATPRGFEIFVLAWLMGSACWMFLSALGLIIHVM
jgi:uncharacterized RDD family membrane protein YckC